MTATAAVTLPLEMTVGGSSYIASKQGLIKALEILAAEEKEVSVRFFHPGVVDTDMTAKSGTGGKLPVDTGEQIVSYLKNLEGIQSLMFHS